MFGLAARGQILALADAVLSGETEKALRQLNDLAQQGKDLSRLISELLSHFRNLLIYQVSRGDMNLIEAIWLSLVEVAGGLTGLGRLCIGTLLVPHPKLQLVAKRAFITRG